MIPWIYADLDTIIDCYSEVGGGGTDMSGVYIKGLEMPTERESFQVTIKYNGVVLDTETGMQVAEAYELPPHGRLIDADALLKGIANDAIWKHDAMNEYDSGIRMGARTIMRSIRNAHTIIEAEGDET